MPILVPSVRTFENGAKVKLVSSCFQISWMKFEKRLWLESSATTCQRLEKSSPWPSWSPTLSGQSDKSQWKPTNRSRLKRNRKIKVSRQVIVALKWLVIQKILTPFESYIIGLSKYRVHFHVALSNIHVELSCTYLSVSVALNAFCKDALNSVSKWLWLKYFLWL